MLKQNGFVVLSDYPAFSIQHYMILYFNFITSDAVLYVFGCLFRGGLHDYERDHLAPTTEELVEAGLEAADQDYQFRRSQSNLREAARRNLVFFAVAARLLGRKVPREVAAEARRIADKVRRGEPVGY